MDHVPLAASLAQITTGILEAVLGFLHVIAVPVTILFVMIAAFLLLFSGGNREKTGKGWRVLLYACIGYAIILLSTSIPGLVQSFF